MRMLNDAGQDLVHAARSLLKTRAFSLVCVVSLGIGMAPVMAIPYASRVTNVPPAGVRTAGLVELLTTTSGPHEATELWSYPDYRDLRDADTGIELIGWAGAQSEVTLPGTDGPKTRASTLFVSANYFKAIGVALARGPGFDPSADDPLNPAPLVIVGHDFWRNRLNGDPDIVGKPLTVDGVPHLVVGIAPEGFSGHLVLQGGQLYVPLERHPRLRPTPDVPGAPRTDRLKEWVVIHGRLRPGVGVQQASGAVAAVTARLARAYPSTNEYRAGMAASYDPLGLLARRQFRTLQLVGLTLTGAILLVVSLNISGMMQVRSAMRERELSIRQAIGASRARLAQYLLAEAVVMALTGGTLASAVLFTAPELLARLTGNSPMPAPLQEALRANLSTIGIAFGLCLITSLMFGWLPAVRFSRPVILSSMKDDAGVGGLRVGRVHRVTAALQVAIAVPLIVMSGQSLDRVRATAMADLGFASELLYAAPLKLDGLTAGEAGSQMRRSSAELARADGVAAVTVADGLPLDFRYRIARVALQPGADAAPRYVAAQVTRVGEGYFDSMRIPILRGRGFTAEDGAGAEPVTIVSKPLADRLAPGGDVVGRRLLFGADATPDTLTIVGVTADFPTSQMSTEREQLLLPLAQHPGVSWDAVPVMDDGVDLAHVMLVARSVPGDGPGKVTTALARVAGELDPGFMAAGVVSGASLRRRSMDDFLTQSTVSAGAGSVVLMLAALGIYGVVGLMVATRTREIAVRAAIGASRRRVLAMVVLDVVRLVSPGVAAGVVLTVVLNRINAENMGIALSDAEPLAYVAGAVVAVLVAVLAGLAPARRAASVDPMVAMRSL